MKDAPEFDEIRLTLEACGESCVLRAASTDDKTVGGLSGDEMDRRLVELLSVLPKGDSSRGEWREAARELHITGGTFDRLVNELASRRLVESHRYGWWRVVRDTESATDTII